MNTYDKNAGKAAVKATNTLDAVERGVNRIYVGCVAVFANLLFLGFCLWGVYAGYTSWQLQTKGETTTGTVVELVEQSDGQGGCCTYVPIVEYAVSGKTYSIAGGTASDPPQYEVGERVSILYDPASPNKAKINSGIERWLFPIIIIPSMFFTALIVNFFLWRSFRRGDSDMAN